MAAYSGATTGRVTRLVSHIVDYSSGANPAAHRHARSDFIYVYVLSGEIRSQVDGRACPRVHRHGETWFESPGAHHRVSATDTAPARLLAGLIVDVADEHLTIPDSR